MQILKQTPLLTTRHAQPFTHTEKCAHTHTHTHLSNGAAELNQAVAWQP